MVHLMINGTRMTRTRPIVVELPWNSGTRIVEMTHLYFWAHRAVNEGKWVQDRAGWGG